MDSYKQHFYNRNPAASKVKNPSSTERPQGGTKRRLDDWVGPARACLSGSLNIQVSAFHLSEKSALFIAWGRGTSIKQ